MLNRINKGNVGRDFHTLFQIYLFTTFIVYLACSVILDSRDWFPGLAKAHIQSSVNVNHVNADPYMTSCFLANDFLFPGQWLYVSWPVTLCFLASDFMFPGQWLYVSLPVTFCFLANDFLFPGQWLSVFLASDFLFSWPALSVSWPVYRLYSNFSYSDVLCWRASLTRRFF